MDINTHRFSTTYRDSFPYLQALLQPLKVLTGPEKDSRIGQSPLQTEAKGRYKGGHSPVFHKHLGCLFTMLVTRSPVSPTESESLGEEPMTPNVNKFF